MGIDRRTRLQSGSRLRHPLRLPLQMSEITERDVAVLFHEFADRSEVGHAFVDPVRMIIPEIDKDSIFFAAGYEVNFDMS